MSTRGQLSDLEITRLEKFLAIVLAAFVLVGGLWAYAQPLDRTDDGAPAIEQGPGRAGSPADRATVDRWQNARADLRRARRSELERRRDLELAREEYRTALDAGQAPGELEQRYEEAQDAQRAAEERVSEAQRRTDELAAAARPALQRISASQRERAEAARERRDRRERDTVWLRLGWVLLTLALAFLALGRLRRRTSRYLPVGIAAVGAATVQAIVMAADYTTDHIELLETGPLWLSLAGTALSLAAIVALQRYVARRIPLRRVRRGECPFCGFRVVAGEHCEGCGRTIVAPCAACEAPRRVGTPHCAACGNG